MAGVLNVRLADYYGGPKGSITNQFTKTQNNFPKQKLVYQNTNQFLKTKTSLPKHKSFLKTKTSLPKHKSISQNTKQFSRTQINFSKHKPILRNTNQKTGHFLCNYQREPGRNSFPGISVSNMATYFML